MDFSTMLSFNLAVLLLANLHVKRNNKNALLSLLLPILKMTGNVESFQRVIKLFVRKFLPVATFIVLSKKFFINSSLKRFMILSISSWFNDSPSARSKVINKIYVLFDDIFLRVGEALPCLCCSLKA